MINNFPIISHLKETKPFVAFLLFVSLMMYLNYYTMTQLPGTNGFQCILGANFTPGNIFFSVLISLFAGIMVAGLVVLYRERALLKTLKAGSASTAGLAIGTLTTFCTLCTLPTISLFGFGLGLGFVTEYQLYFKGISVVLLGLGIYLLNGQLKGHCRRCKY
ncbi:MAG: hypothetical protein OEY44_03855 [Candidatus Peregrinibacteria bacterium]|nr:hypothetical protein [Candidatus Peregrinibacteria bacterium]